MTVICRECNAIHSWFQLSRHCSRRFICDLFDCFVIVKKRFLHTVFIRNYFANKLLQISYCK